MTESTHPPTIKDMPDSLEVLSGRGNISSFAELKTWQDDDLRAQSLERDVFATAKMCELLGLCSFAEAQAFREPFIQLADLGYAGYGYYHFASVSIQGIVDLFETLMREIKGDPEWEAIHKWAWTGEVLNARVPGSHGDVRMVFKNKTEEDRTAISFGRFLRYDDRWGVVQDETHHVAMAAQYVDEFGAAHPEVTPIALPYLDLFTLVTMDVVNRLHPQPGDDGLTKRVPLTHALRDVSAGRWLPGERTGHLFLNTDTSLGMEATSGFEALKTSICVGAAIPSGEARD